jgi:hypothetical protein
MRSVLGKALIVAASFALGAGVACSKTNNVDQSRDTTNNTYVKTVGPKGAEVGDTQSLGVFLPRDALSSSEDISIGPASDEEYPELPANAAGSVYSFQPHGILFNRPVDVYLPAPSGNPTDYVMLHAAPGGQWETIKPETPRDGATAVRGKVLSFSFFALAEAAPGGTMNGSGDGVAGGAVMAPDAGVNPGSSSGTGGGGTAVGGTSGNMGGNISQGGTKPAGAGGVPGTGGTSGEATCMEEAGAPFGSSKGSGTLLNQQGTKLPFNAIDGYAIITDMVDPPELTLVFSEYPHACGMALGMHGSPQMQQHQPSLRAESQALTAHLRLDPSSQPLLLADTYPRAGKADTIDAQYHRTADQCQAEEMVPQPSNTKTLILEVQDGKHVKGNLSLEHTATGASISLDFDVPICRLDETPAPGCCIQ